MEWIALSKTLSIILMIAGLACIALGILNWESVKNGDRTFVQFMWAPGIGALLLLASLAVRALNRP